MNKYAIITIEQLDEFYPHYIGEKEDQRLSLDGTKAVIKFPYKEDAPEEMNTIPVYTHEEILEIINGPEWSPQEI